MANTNAGTTDQTYSILRRPTPILGLTTGTATTTTTATTTGTEMESTAGEAPPLRSPRHALRFDVPGARDKARDASRKPSATATTKRGNGVMTPSDKARRSHVVSPRDAPAPGFQTTVDALGRPVHLRRSATADPDMPARSGTHRHSRATRIKRATSERHLSRARHGHGHGHGHAHRHHQYAHHNHAHGHSHLHAVGFHRTPSITSSCTTTTTAAPTSAAAAISPSSTTHSPNAAADHSPPRLPASTRTRRWAQDRHVQHLPPQREEELDAVFRFFHSCSCAVFNFFRNIPTFMAKIPRVAVSLLRSVVPALNRSSSRLQVTQT